MRLELLNLTSKSLFRLSFFQKQRCSNIIVDFEKRILKDRLLLLNKEEIEFLSKNWNNLKIQMELELEMFNIEMNKSYKNYILGCN